MTAQQPPKRLWRPWYKYVEPPICHKCQIPCITKHTQTTEEGKKIQRRYCPKCGGSFKTTYFP